MQRVKSRLKGRPAEQAVEQPIEAPGTPAVDQTSVDRLVAAAVEAFAERGYHATTTRQIAEAAGMSPAALYAHFQSKEELLARVIRATHAQVVSDLHAAFAQRAESAGERLARLVVTNVHFQVTHPSEARVANAEVRLLARNDHDEIMALLAEVENMFAEAIRMGVRAGEFQVGDERLTAVAILSLIIDVSRSQEVARRVTTGNGGNVDTLAAGYAELALRMVGVDASIAESLSRDITTSPLLFTIPI